jgi:hypothetical protein
MEAKNDIQAQMFQVLAELPVSRQVEVLDFALFLRERERTYAWDAISDEEAMALRAEFAAEDLALAEAAMTDYLSRLQREDEA